MFGDELHSPDHPGLSVGFAPEAAAFYYSLIYNWTGTFTCAGTDKSSDSKSTSISSQLGISGVADIPPLWSP